jgi:hypothetical protein
MKVTTKKAKVTKESQKRIDAAISEAKALKRGLDGPVLSKKDEKILDKVWNDHIVHH